MACQQDGPIEILFDIFQFIFGRVPAWTSIPVAILGGLGIEWFWRSHIPVTGLYVVGHLVAGIFVAACLLGALKALFLQREQERFLQQEIDLAWVKQLSWREFERHAARVYRQKGFQVEERGGGGPDGGIDLVLKKDGKTTVVQCKHWKRWQVGVGKIYELLGVMTAEKADAALFIASGLYTGPAREFARKNSIELIGRNEFIELIRQFQRDLAGGQQPISPASSVFTPDCPLCKRPMVIRTAKKGPTAGEKFWGCPAWPECKGNRSVV